MTVKQSRVCRTKQRKASHTAKADTPPSPHAANNQLGHTAQAGVQAENVDEQQYYFIHPKLSVN